MDDRYYENMERVNTGYGKPRFSRTEIRDILVAVTVLTVAFATLYRDSNSILAFFEYGCGLEGRMKYAGLIGMCLVVVVLSFLLHEFGHKFMAQRYGLWSEFRMWPLGLALTMVSSFLGFMFASPGAVMIAGNVDSARNGKISIAGPAVNIVIGAIAIAGCLLCNHSGWVVLFMMLANLNSFLALFNLLPIPPLDGSKIISWNLAVWIVAIAIAAAEVLYIWQYMPTLYWG